MTLAGGRKPMVSTTGCMNHWFRGQFAIAMIIESLKE